MHDIDRYGIGAVMDMTLEHLAKKDHIHVSYDIDALDPFFAPATGTAVRGGLTFREGNYVCEAVFSTGKLSSMELVEVNPTVTNQLSIAASTDTVEMAMTLIGSAMGKQCL
jgi:arginase